MIKKNFITIGLIIFILFSLSLILGLYLNEDASGLGTSNDFKSTWPYVLSLKNNYIIDGSEWTRLLPLHYIFLSLLQENLNDIFLVRLFFVFISLLIPFLFYLNLKIKFPEIDKGKLLIISSIIIILPFFRSSSIWPNPHITSLVFLLSSFYFFSKWEQLKIKVFDRDLILHIIFLALAVYTRRYYIFFFLYFLIIYFTNLNIKNFLLASIFIFILSIPGFALIFHFPYYLSSTGYSFKFYNSLLIISSIFCFYMIPFFDYKIIKNLNKKIIYIVLASIIFTIFLSILFNYDPKLGGGFFIKLSNILFFQNYFFYMTAAIGFFMIYYLVSNNMMNALLISLIFLFFSNDMILQKYFEPLLLIIFFLLINSKQFLNSLISKNRIFFILFYFIVYSVSSIINSKYQISLNYFW